MQTNSGAVLPKTSGEFLVVLDTADQSLLLETVSSFGLSWLPPISLACKHAVGPELQPQTHSLPRLLYPVLCFLNTSYLLMIPKFISPEA